MLNSTSGPATSPSGHPGWCYPPSCINTGQDTEHSSAAASLDTSTAQMIEAALIRRDGQRDFDDEPGQTLLRIDLTDLRIDGRNVQFDVPAEDLPKIARFLMTRYEEYLFCSQQVRS